MKNRLYLLSILALFAIAGTLDCPAQIAPVQPKPDAVTALRDLRSQVVALKANAELLSVQVAPLVPPGPALDKFDAWTGGRMLAYDAVLGVIDHELAKLMPPPPVVTTEDEGIVIFTETVTASRKELLP